MIKLKNTTKKVKKTKVTYRILTVMFLLLILYFTTWPVSIDPIAWQAPANPGYSGPYEINKRLGDIQLLSIGSNHGPEDIALDAHGRIYASTHEGRIVRLQADGSNPEDWVDTGGRPLGIEFDLDGNLIVADAFRGLLSVAPDGIITELTRTADGIPIRYANNVAVGTGGKIYFTDASTKFGARQSGDTYAASLLDLMEHGANGRLLVYDRITGETNTLLDNLHFANGVAVSSDQTYVLVNETGSYRVIRYWLAGPHKGQAEPFIEALPGFPDNLSRSASGRYWVALISPRSVLLDKLASRPFLRKVVQRLPAFMRPKARPYGHLIALDADGRVVVNLQDPSGRLPLNTSAVESSQFLYVGSLVAPFIGRLKVPSEINSSAASSETIVLKPSFSELNIKLEQLEYCITDKSTDFEDVLKKDFKKLDRNVFGFQDFKIWLRFTIQNESKLSDLIIYQDYPLIDYCNIYYVDGSGNLKQIKSGDQIYIKDRDIKHRHITFPINQTAYKQTYYISYATEGAFNIFLSVFERNTLFTKLLNRDVLYIFCYGFVIAILLYNTILYIFQINETDYKYFFWYILLLISYLFAHASLDGLALQYLWSTQTWWANHSITVFAGLMFASILQFVRSYLKIRNYCVWLDNVGVCLTVYFLFFVTFFNFFNLRLSFQFTNIGGILLGLYLLSTSLYLWLKKSSDDAKFFLMTWVLFAVSIIVLMLKQMGFLPHNLLTDNAARIGFTVQSFLLSIALSQKINRMKKELIRLNNLKDDFLANTTHELKTPLHGIIGISDYLIDNSDLNSGVRKDLLSISYSARRLSNLVNDLLDTAKIKKGSVVLNQISCNLRTMVDIIIDITAPLNKTKKIKIINKVDGDLFVSADENRLLQILQNLIENAIKYTEHGSIIIGAKLIDGNYIKCSVADTGIGIADKNIDRIFLSFTQGDINCDGSGLGLSITKNLVELHGGKLSVYSTEGKSSTFTFSLPVATNSDQVQENFVPTRKLNDTPAVNFFKNNNKANYKIIAVDDDVMNLQILNNVLVQKYQVVTEISGSNILKIINDNKPDLILLDVMMPNVDGFEVCGNIRKHYSLEELPILFVTARNQFPDVVRGFEFGGNDYITKPFSKDELISRIDTHLKLKTANHRLRKLRSFSNSIGKSISIRELIISAGKYLSSDKLISSVKIVYDKNIIFSSDNSKEANTLKKLAKAEGNGIVQILNHKKDIFALVELENGFIIICELANESAVDYVKNILFQVRAIQDNINKIVSNKQIINSAHTIFENLEDCNYIKGSGKYSDLYKREGESVFIGMRVGQLEVYFNKFLHRVHKSYLVNPNNIYKISKNGKGIHRICFNNGESIPVGNKYKAVLTSFKSGFATK